jgi:hypothetical protein
MSPIDIIIAGFEMLMEYLSAHVRTCLVPAFLFFLFSFLGGP